MGGRAIGVYVDGGVPVGIYRVVEGMGITNFTMVVPTVQSSRARGRMEWRAGGSRRLRNSFVRLLDRELCSFQVRGGGVGRLSSSSIATAMAPKLTTYVSSRSSACQVGGRAIGVYVDGGVPVGIYRVVEGMGITNFTMVVPTVQSSRVPLEGHRLGWVGGKLWSAVEGRRWGHRLVRGRPELGRRAGARQSQVVR